MSVTFYLPDLMAFDNRQTVRHLYSFVHWSNFRFRVWRQYLAYGVTSFIVLSVCTSILATRTLVARASVAGSSTKSRMMQLRPTGAWVEPPAASQSPWPLSFSLVNLTKTQNKLQSCLVRMMNLFSTLNLAVINLGALRRTDYKQIWATVTLFYAVAQVYGVSY